MGTALSLVPGWDRRRSLCPRRRVTRRGPCYRTSRQPDGLQQEACIWGTGATGAAGVSYPGASLQRAACSLQHAATTPPPIPTGAGPRFSVRSVPHDPPSTGGAGCRGPRLRNMAAVASGSCSQWRTGCSSAHHRQQWLPGEAGQRLRPPRAGPRQGADTGPVLDRPGDPTVS